MENILRLPKFHETFIPILTVLSDGEVIHYNDLQQKVRDIFYSNLPQELLDQKTKSGAPIILDRIGWGKVYLKQAGMVIQPKRAMVQITEKGREVLKRGVFTLSDIFKDAEFLANRKNANDDKQNISESDEDSPQDLIDRGFQVIETQIKLDLLAKLQGIDPYFFEKIVLLLLEKMGYGDFLGTPKSGDGGIDGIINQDKLGLDRIYIQAKRYGDGNKVREGEIRNFIGAMSRDALQGIFVTTSSFDEKAIQKAKDAQQKIILIDGPKLVNLMYQYGIGVQVKNTYEVKQIDEDFFDVV